MNEKTLCIHASSLYKIKPIVEAHLRALTLPMDSYLEYRLTVSQIYEIVYNGKLIGYAGFNDGVLSYFHVLLAHYDLAPDILERLIEERQVKCIYVNTQDPCFAALMAEWDYEKKLDSCWFIDGRNLEKERKIIEGAVMRVAEGKDIERIAAETDPFFDSLEQRVREKTIFMLERGDELLGCGLIEKSELSKDHVSIGMVTCKAFRQQGVGQSILWDMKAWAYNHGYQPIAGCAYHNKPSRKTLERAGMVVMGIGYEAILKRKLLE